MLDIFSGLRLVVRRRVVNIDNAIFRCHWFFTSTLLVSFSLIITARQYVGQPIECHSVDKIPDSLLNSYCWVQSTFNVPQACDGQPGVDVPYPCIDNTRGREIKVYAYYQWVGIVLFIQGLMFHLPYYLWKLWENGLIKAITGGLRVAVLNEHERAKKKEIVVDYIHDHLGCHKRYALKYFLCEFICLINLLGQLWATNKFFDGQFMRYGLEVLEYSSSSISGQFINTIQPISSGKQSLDGAKLVANATTTNGVANKAQASNPTINTNYHISAASSSSSPSSSSSSLAAHQKQLPTAAKQQVDPMTLIFPRMSKCRYHDFGSSGDIQTHDALCILPLNIINEKIYIALWFWFFILAILTVIVIIYRIFAIISENVRCKGLISRCKLSSERDIRLICRHCDVGDWFLFYMIAENVDPLIMREIVASIAVKITNHLQLKEELRAQVEQDSDRDKLRLLMDEQYRIQSASEHVSSFNPDMPDGGDGGSGSDSRRASAAVFDQVPLVRKLKKRLYNKRLWSIDLGSGELRQQLFGGGGQMLRRTSGAGLSSSQRDGPDGVASAHGGDIPMAEQHSASVARTATSSLQFASAPPISEMALNGIPPLRRALHRRGSLTRQTSSSSTSGVSSSAESSPGSFVMEMSNVCGGRSSPLLTAVVDGPTAVARRGGGGGAFAGWPLGNIGHHHDHDP
jgi:hypothetical protein